ncbi:MAG: hypothetical protein R2932_43085 [Caldilineaceae bacterium]
MVTVPGDRRLLCAPRQPVDPRVVVPADSTGTGKPIAYAFVSQTDAFVHEQRAGAL